MEIVTYCDVKSFLDVIYLVWHCGSVTWNLL